MSLRPVKQIFETKPTIEGAGVKLQRAFGFGKTTEFDPFLLLDDFRSDNPADYLAGIPWHPHRGIETITYVLAGEVAHGDSLGNKGRMTAGDVQWMTAGSGILHQEMPEGVSLGHLLMQNSDACGHSLHMIGGHAALVAQAVAVRNFTSQDVGDGFDAPVGMPGKSCDVIGWIVTSEIV